MVLSTCKPTCSPEIMYIINYFIPKLSIDLATGITTIDLEVTKDQRITE